MSAPDRHIFQLELDKVIAKKARACVISTQRVDQRLSKESSQIRLQQLPRVDRAAAAAAAVAATAAG